MIGRDDWLSAGGIRYRFRAAGPAPDHTGSATPPLVLVHGLGVSIEYWARLLPLLATRRRVYAVDLPGFGRSTRPARALDSAELARALCCWLAGLGLPRAHFLGHSLGAPVVAELAHERPERVAHLVLVAPTIGKRGPHLLHRALDTLRNIPREDLTLASVVLPAYLRAGLPRLLRTDRLTTKDDTVATVVRLRGPLLIARGTRDCVVDNSAVRLLLRAARRASLVEIPGAAHGVQWSHARALAWAVDAYLDGASRPALAQAAFAAPQSGSGAAPTASGSMRYGLSGRLAPHSAHEPSYSLTFS